MNLNTICKNLGFADWDLIVVTEDRLSKSKNNNKKKDENVFYSINNMDAYVLSATQWQNEMLSHHRFLCWLVLFLPDNAVWKEILPMYAFPKDRSLVLEWPTLMASVKKEVLRDSKKMQKFWDQNKQSKAKKTFTHILRMVWLAKEIISYFQTQLQTQQLPKIMEFGPLINETVYFIL
ncbi:hypothetical protein RFI_29268 [Reticulomyxa filosa]|uniref:Uncharacterized protein n=1 Tax=Reticulomyxa filosa TaxID=46433 RepID=X6M508_RETFI|nr:hypothetical protein RFI_29268 [Reticulomyxa filosa]|eukprot:ETO08120.1 hypothetical protein RFI_29268 [Reticulomyxa filosa]